VWFLIANVGNHVLRMTWPGYSEVEVAKTFTVGMLIARLFLGAICSLCAGFVAAWITNRSVLAIKSLAGLLLIMFLPRDHVVGTFSALVSCDLSRVSRRCHAAWRIALSPPPEATQCSAALVASFVGG
jgi:hypothetical protein